MTITNSGESANRQTPSLFGPIEPYAGDPILSLNEAFGRDTRPEKVNLGIGVYMDRAGQVPLLDCVREAQRRILDRKRTYLPMEGEARYRASVQSLVFGSDHPALAEGRIATVQTLGGTGALMLAAEFLAKHCPGRTVYISDPTWENHFGLFQRVGFRTKTYPYWSNLSEGISFQAMCDVLSSAGDGSIVILQPVCHNPTGLDLPDEQQACLIELLSAKHHVVIFDMAYQGFGDDLDRDAGFVRRFASQGLCCLVANSFSKNFSLYGERCGGLSIVCRDPIEAKLVLGQLQYAVRRSYSSPPLTGGAIIAEVLHDRDLRNQWQREVSAMNNRMKAMRRGLFEEIRRITSHFDASFLVDQRGMFSMTGLSVHAIRTLRERDAVYLVENGRLCIAGLTEANIPYVAQSLARVIDT